MNGEKIVVVVLHFSGCVWLVEATQVLDSEIKSGKVERKNIQRAQKRRLILHF